MCETIIARRLMGARQNHPLRLVSGPWFRFNAPMRADNPSPAKKRAKALFRLALCAALSAGLCALIAAQWMAPVGKTMPMWLFGVFCLALICFIADTAFGARRDFEEARFLRARALHPTPAPNEAPAAPVKSASGGPDPL